MKIATVALVGRPNAGKSTLMNSIVGQKVSIVSPKPQTTQFSVYGVYEDERGQLIFVDTPGIFAKTKSPRAKGSNLEAEQVLKQDVTVIAYVLDHTKERGFEENRVLGIVRKSKLPKILVINKIDRGFYQGIANAASIAVTPSGRARGHNGKKSYLEQYLFLEDEFDKIVEVSALKGKNVSVLLDTLFDFAKEGEKYVEKEELVIPALNINSHLYIEEVTREKAFLELRKEVPYQIRVAVEEITERKNEVIYIKAILYAASRYKKMIIGSGAKKIKEIGFLARRELETATGKKIYLELTVEAE